MSTEKEKLFAKFEADGEDTVRDNLAAKRYRDRKEPFAREWLRLQEDKRSRATATRNEDVQGQQIRARV